MSGYVDTQLAVSWWLVKAMSVNVDDHIAGSVREHCDKISHLSNKLWHLWGTSCCQPGGRWGPSTLWKSGDVQTRLWIWLLQNLVYCHTAFTNVLNVQPPVLADFLVSGSEFFIRVKLYALYLCKCDCFNIRMCQKLQILRHELRQHN